MEIDLNDGLDDMDGYYSDMSFFMADKKLRSASADNFSDSHQLSSARAGCDIMRYTTRQPHQS